MARSWNYDCPEGCSFYIVVAMDSGAGEKAARMMDQHIADHHGGVNGQASRHVGASKPCPDVSSQPEPVSQQPVGPV